jgi:hypothetical protein
VETSEDHYRFRFPKSAERYETHVVVNRLSGEMAWEHGNAPFGSWSPGNVYQTGRCTKVDTSARL